MEEQYGKDEVKKIVKETRLKHKGWGHLIELPDGCYTSSDWCSKVGYTGYYETFEDMIIGEYGDESEQARDLDKTYREAVLANEKTYLDCYKCEREFDWEEEHGSTNIIVDEKLYSIFFCGDCWEDEVEHSVENEALGCMIYNPEPSERCLIGECDCEGDEKATCDGSNLVRD